MSSNHVGILAPIVDSTQAVRDFRIRVGSDGHELTLRNLNKLIEKDYDLGALKGHAYSEDTVPAAGFYLTGLLRANGYSTHMTNQLDAASLREMAGPNPLAICISTTMINTAQCLRDTVNKVRAAVPGVPIILGGMLIWRSHLFSTTCKEILEGDEGAAYLSTYTVFPAHKSDLDVDVIVVSPHGSEMLLGVLAEMKQGGASSLRNLQRIPNLALPNESGLFVKTKLEEEDIDWDVEFPRWDLVDKLPSRVPIRTSLGCPYRCEYCDFCQLQPRLITRSKESLTKELAMIRSRSRRAVLHVTDDIVFASRKRLREVCQTFIDSGLRKVWGGFLRAAKFIPEEMDLVVRSGFKFGMMGVETGDQAMLDRMRKMQKKEHVTRCIEALDNAGITVLMTMLCGFPGENDESLGNTIDFLSTVDVAHGSYQLYPFWVSPLSGAATPELREKYNLVGFGANWKHDTMDRAGAEQACEKVFREARGLPFQYSTESQVHNSQWSRSDRRALYDLRRRLTVELLEDAPHEILSGTVQELAVGMGHEKAKAPDPTWWENLNVEKAAALSARESQARATLRMQEVQSRRKPKKTLPVVTN